MSILNSYLSQGKVKQVLARRPGEAGFSLIELVVVVAVLAILAAIAIPSFTSINNKARASAAANVVATTAKQCAVKYANGETTDAELTIPKVSLDSYQSLEIDGSETKCSETGEIVALSSDESRYPTFTYNIETGDKDCVINGANAAEQKAVGCIGGKW